MRPIKNGFYHVGPDAFTRSGDLWGCLKCKRFQLHGVPKPFPWWPIYPCVDGAFETDPQNDLYNAYLEPDFLFSEHFIKHMEEWYPEWEVKE